MFIPSFFDSLLSMQGDSLMDHKLWLEAGHYLETFPCFSTNQSMSLRAMLILPGIGGK